MSSSDVGIDRRVPGQHHSPAQGLARLTTERRLLQAIDRFIARYCLSIDLDKHRIQLLAPRRFQKLANSDAYKQQIAAGIRQAKNADRSFSWPKDKELVCAV